MDTAKRGDGGEEDVRLRVVSYNVHRCVGGDGAHLPDRVASVLRDIDADVVALQEVDSGFETRFGVDQLEFLAQEVGMRAIAGPTLRSADGHYGNALLTKLPIRTVRHVDLSVSRREPRGAIDADIEFNGSTLRVVATHFGLRARERRAQARRLVRHLGTYHRDLTLLLGDFNEWRPIGGALGSVERIYGRSHRVRSFPARYPLLALDRIWVHPKRAMGSLYVCDNATACIASDHLPVVAHIRWPSGEPGGRSREPTDRAAAPVGRTTASAVSAGAATIAREERWSMEMRGG